MAYMLGSQACMESLQNDIQDLQWAITDVCSRAGEVRCPSWKYPDKIACDLDIEELLETYSFSQDSEECQVSHIALYELVIDRMVLLIHAFAKYTDQLLTSRSSGDNSAVASSSVGLVVKKYWSRLVELHTSIQQEKSENKSKTRKVTDLEKLVSKLSEEVKQNHNQSPSMTPSLMGLIPLNDADLARLNGGSRKPREGGISQDEYTKSCQTYETAFVPCESCSVVQNGLREAGKSIIEMCQNQSLPTSLKRFYAQTVDNNWLAYNDVRRWVAEQNKDVQRLGKHFEQIVATIKPLKAEVAECEKSMRKAELKVSKCENDLMRERETQDAVRKQFDIKFKESERRFSEDLAVVTHEKSQLAGTKKDLERTVNSLKEKLESQQETLKQLEMTNNQLKSDLEDKTGTVLEIEKLKNHAREFEKQLVSVSESLEQASRDLTREQAKNRSVSKHEQSLQQKQGSLVNHIDVLDRENAELRDQVAGLEDEKEAAEETLSSTQEKIKQLQKTMKENEAAFKNLTSQKDELQKDLEETRGLIQKLEVKLEEAKERERLIIEYPDLNGPVNPDYQGSGDIVQDMNQQVRANTVRINLLETQNEGLRNSITKVVTMQAARTEPVKYERSPTQLWKTSCPEERYREDKTQTFVYVDDQYHNDRYHNDRDHNDRDHNDRDQYHNDRYSNLNNSSSSYTNQHKQQRQPSAVSSEQSLLSNSSHTRTNDSFLVGRSTRPSSATSAKASSRQGRPLSANRFPVNASSVSAYIQMKKTGHLSQGNENKTIKGSSKPPIGKPRLDAWAGEDRFGYAPPTFACALCDKMYTSSKDLEIHKSYCTG